MGDLHIASCVAYVRPEAVEGVTRAIHATQLAEVPRQDKDSGKLVLLVERGSSGQVMDVIDAIRALDGVLAVHLAYQHAEPEDDLQQLHANPSPRPSPKGEGEHHQDPIE
jgi:periplasmic nitrate reductase NapD